MEEYFRWKSINYYLTLEDHIRKVRAELEELTATFYEQSFSTRVESDGLELVSVGVKVENAVTKLVDSQASKERRIEALQKKQKYFKDYLATLSAWDKVRLLKQYVTDTESNYTDDQLSKDTYREILEIEEAMMFLNGEEPEIIPPLELDNESLDQDLNYMFEALGV
ncbi:hypothetical protein J2R98_002321 [Alkalibacillus filiformis]|uniref:Uncharacterized protein n=1 Tax=Alkalibacillus filiformis TaxID=200990 RepID=A0ABU0DVJ5_9BACI|nr:hypothetical protein [Alkalibacillus filiformis]MDQ0352477.1 hypothetical protein [Alkalibacillus filiformis]